jgi:PmbA protein
MEKEKNKKYSDRNTDIAAICEKISEKVSKEKVDQWEIYGAAYSHNEIDLYKKEIENLSFADTRGIGIRIIKEGRTGYAYTSNLARDAINSCILKAIENSEISDPDENNVLPLEKEDLFLDPEIDDDELFSRKILDFSTHDKVTMSRELENAAFSSDKRVSGINNLIYEDSISETAIINSNGFSKSFKSSSSFMYISVISRKGSDVSTGDYFDYKRDPSFFNISDIAFQAVKKSTSLLGARKIKSLKTDLLMDPFVGAQFLNVISGIVSADAVQKGKSLFKGKIGKKIFSIDVDVIDNGIMRGGMATQPFDAEGVPKGITTVFEKGVLKNFLYNSYTARKDGVKNTGNAVRSSYKSIPETGPSNFYMENGIKSFEDLLKKIDRGFYVIDIMGVHSGVNPVSGQISVGAKGIWIENGHFAFPVKEVTIASDIFSICKSLAETGNDLKFMPSGGYTGSPSLLFREIAVSGN